MKGITYLQVVHRNIQLCEIMSEKKFKRITKVYSNRNEKQLTVTEVYSNRIENRFTVCFKKR